MNRIYDEGEWFEQYDLNELDYLDGYATYMEGGSEHWNESPSWREGFENAKIVEEFQRSLNSARSN